jgi:S-adenosylmethionine decarboxylase
LTITSDCSERGSNSLFKIEQAGRRAGGILRTAVISHEQPMLYSADLGGCHALDTFDAEGIAAVFAEALRGAGATIVQEVSHAYPEHGLTCVLVLRESHAVLHTWPETGTVNIDIFSCSTRLKSLAAIEELGRLLGARQVSVQEIPRADGRSQVPAQAGA